MQFIHVRDVKAGYFTPRLKEWRLVAAEWGGHELKMSTCYTFIPMYKTIQSRMRTNESFQFDRATSRNMPPFIRNATFNLPKTFRTNISLI